MEITLDLNKLTAAEVDVLEDALNAACDPDITRLAKRAKAVGDDRLAAMLATHVIRLDDLARQFQWEAAARDAEKEGRVPPPFAGVYRVPNLVALRVVELVQLRQTNPNATWADTGQDPVFANASVEAEQALPPPTVEVESSTSTASEPTP